jgi:hypothetical protein
MELIRYSDLPQIMRDLDSPLFKSFNDDDEFMIDKKYIFKEYNIKTIEDLIVYFEIIRFLMIEKLPYEIYDFIFENTKLFIQDNISLLINTFPEFEHNFIKEIIIILNSIPDDKSELIYNNIIYSELIKHGLMNAFQWALSRLSIYDKGYQIIDYCSIAALYNQLDILKLLLSMGYKLEEEYMDPYEDEYDDECSMISLTEMLAEDGCLECLKFIHEELGYYWDYNAIIKAIEPNNLECLKYLYENGCPYEESIITIACVNQSSDCLNYLLNKGHVVSKKDINYIILFNNIECLECILENNSYQLEDSFYHLAISKGYIECIKLLHKYNCPWNPQHYQLAISQWRIDIIEYLDTHDFLR